MNCEACGGDGLIEVGAYRGDEGDTTTRECRLCGGVVATALLSSGLPQLLSLHNGKRQAVAVPHVHKWKQPEPFGPYVRFGCDSCSKGLVFSKHGNLSEGEAPNSLVLDKLSRIAVAFAARNEEQPML